MFTPSCYYWHALTLLKRSVFVLISLFLMTDISSKSCCFSALNLLSQQLHVIAKPFKSDILHRCEFFSHTILILVSILIALQDDNATFSPALSAVLFLLIVPPAIAIFSWIGWTKISTWIKNRYRAKETHTSKK
jgi:hypothetical protein